MSITLCAAGGGNPETMTIECRDALANADCIIGAGRLMENINMQHLKVTDKASCELKKAVNPDEILRYIKERQGRNICIIYSGDTGFYSGAGSLIKLLEAEKFSFTVLPGLSSVQLLSARLCLPWQDWKLVSAHGVACDAVREIAEAEGRDVFFLTGGDLTPDAIAAQLCSAGLGTADVIVGENLSYKDSEKILHMSAKNAADRKFAPLSVMLVKNRIDEKQKNLLSKNEVCATCHSNSKWSFPGIPDDEFIRGSVPMTKREIRALIMMLMEIKYRDTVWDIGAGTGSVSVEAALAAYSGKVFAVECVESAIELINLNREKFKLRNLQIVNGHAPEVLSDLPKPDRVFIGGSRGCMKDIIDEALSANPKAVICISAIAIETVHEATAALEAHGIASEITQIACSHSKQAGKLHMMIAENPITLIIGKN